MVCLFRRYSVSPEPPVDEFPGEGGGRGGGGGGRGRGIGRIDPLMEDRIRLASQRARGADWGISIY